MSVSVIDWGAVDGRPVQLWTLVSEETGMRMRVASYGCIVTELHVPGRGGKFVDVALGRPTLQDYVERTQYFGCTAGRCANRICKGKFCIDGVPFQATCNNGQNCLHGGAKGFDKVVWDAQASVELGTPKITLSYTSEHGEEGFPGTVRDSTLPLLIFCNIWSVARHRGVRSHPCGRTAR
jgi:aldose 1-epimerase